MLKIRAHSLLMLVALVSGCGGSNSTAPGAQGAVVSPVLADMPVCPAAPAPTGVVPSAKRFAAYHLADHASDRDRLFLAVLKDDQDTLKSLLAAGADVNSTHGRSYSVASDSLVTFADDAQAEQLPLIFWAAESSGSADTIQVLLSKGAPITAKDSNGKTVLMAAAGNVSMDASALRAILDAGADVKERDKDQQDALLHAVTTDSTDAAAVCLLSSKLQTLIHAGADINENFVYPPIMVALYNRDLPTAKLIRALGGNLRAIAAFDGSSSLHMLARAADDNVDTVRWVLARGISLHVKDRDHKTALQLFQDNLAQGRCHSGDSANPHVNPCARGTQEIIKAIGLHHKR